MYPISSWEESWFPGFYWRGRPTFNKHHKRSLPSEICNWEGSWVCCLNWSGYWDALTHKKVGFPCSGLNAGSSFIWHDEGMSESPVGNLEKVVGPHLILTLGLTSLDTSRVTWSSILQNVTMRDSSWKLIGIPISHCQLEMDAWSLTSPREESVLSCQA